MNSGLAASDRSNRRDSRGRDDYHHVKVTGLNSAVWPDPPGYHARHRSNDDEERQEPVRGHRQKHGHRKTEGGTKSNK